MDKKQLILNILYKLERNRDLAQGLILLLNNDLLPESLIDFIIKKMELHLTSIKDKKTKQIFMKSINLLKNIQEKEILYQKDEVNNIERLFDNV